MLGIIKYIFVECVEWRRSELFRVTGTIMGKKLRKKDTFPRGTCGIYRPF